MEFRTVLFGLAFALTCLHGLVESSQQACPSDDWLDLGTDKCYYIRSILSTWHDASNFCQNLAPGAQLVVIQSRQEQDLFKRHLRHQVWIGTRKDYKTNYLWTVDGSGVTFTNWASDQPNNYLGVEECIKVYSDDLQWRDYPCSSTSGAICEFKKATPCPEPKKEAKATFIGRCDRLLPGQECRYSCPDDLTPTNQGKMTCQRNRSWNTPIAQCKAIPCPEPRTVNKAKFIGNCHNVTPGSVCRFNCPDSLTPRNLGRMICRANGKWDVSEAECSVVSCPEPRLDPNAVLSVNCAKAAPGSHCTFKCKNNLTPKDSGVLSCKERGEWHPTIAICQAISCPEPEKHGKATFKTNCKGLHPGEECLYSCRDNLTPINGGKLICSGRGRYDHLTADCQAIPCQEPAKYSPVRFISSCKNVPPNSQCRFTCSDNLTPMFGGQLTCLAGGKWNFPIAECDAVLCPEPKRDSRAEFKTDCDFLNPGEQCAFTCPDNFRARNGGKLTCRAGGKWDIPTAECLQASNSPTLGSYKTLMAAVKGKHPKDVSHVKLETN